jgi:uncharacterized membrane protein YkvA (DUF1232 family)
MSKVPYLEVWKQRARALRVEVAAVALAARDPRVPWYAKLLAALVVAYALSPIDLIPDFIPVLGYLDDLLLLPLGILLVIRLIPRDVMAECRAQAREVNDGVRRPNWRAAAVIVAVWAIALALAARWLSG